ncbi:MAG: Gfo/Idh/MocA family oxidoreductase [Methanoregulaceae archaeon]|nr:Gfo/Idh/MocA family oxidoreductase [Methanoregulaceae archaeon]
MDIGVIGTGMMGRNHARILSELKTVGALLVYDSNRTAAEDVAGKTGATVTASLEEILTLSEAVVICVPTAGHLPVAREAARRGVHFLVEKPVCSTTSEAAEMIAAVPSGLITGVGHIERFNPIVDEIRRIVRKPLYVEAKRHNPASSRVSGSPVVEDLMIHDIDIIRNVLFSGEYSVKSAGFPDICGALFSFGSTPVYLSASRKSSKKIRMIYVEEEDRTIEGDFMSQEVFVYRKPGQYNLEGERYVQENIIEKVMVNKLEPLRVELSTFVSCVREGRDFPITLEQGKENIMICEEIIASPGYFPGST